MERVIDNEQQQAVPTIVFQLHPNGQLTASCNVANVVMALGMIDLGRDLVKQQIQKPRRQVELPPPGLNGESLRGK